MVWQMEKSKLAIFAEGTVPLVLFIMAAC